MEKALQRKCVAKLFSRSIRKYGHINGVSRTQFQRVFFQEQGENARGSAICCANPEGEEDNKDIFRRKGRSRPSTPDDTPLRDGNRDRLIGLLTERAAKTLLAYSFETNVHLYQWLYSYIENNPIPRNGKWEDVSGDMFLSGLMLSPAELARANPKLDPMYDCTKPLTVDPRQIAQRIMDIRVALAKEFIEDLGLINEENMELLRKTLMASLKSSPEATESEATESETTEKDTDAKS